MLVTRSRPIANGGAEFRRWLATAPRIDAGPWNGLTGFDVDAAGVDLYGLCDTDFDESIDALDGLFDDSGEEDAEFSRDPDEHYDLFSPACEFDETEF